MPAIWTQNYPPKAKFTEQNIGSQQGKVFLITGATSGVGFYLASYLYKAHGTVYIASRSKEKGAKAVDQIKNEGTNSKGRIEFLYLDLGDFTTIKPAVEEFKRRESKIDVLWNNAGIGGGDTGPERSAQGHVQQYAINCIGPLLFTRLLQKQLEAADGIARVIWTGSVSIEMFAPTGGVKVNELDTETNEYVAYASSKVGNWFIASEMAKEEDVKMKKAGRTQPEVIHLTINPGNLKTPIWRNLNSLFVRFLNLTMLYPGHYGAYPALWAGLSDEVTPQDSGRYVIPWGRWHPQPREDFLTSMKSEEEGGTGVASKFVEWCQSKHQGFE